MEFAIAPSPVRADYLRGQRLDDTAYLGLLRKIYVTTGKPAAWSADQAGVFNDLLLEGGDHLLMEDGTSVLYLENSSSVTTSLLYLFQDNDPALFAGAALGKSAGSDVTDLSLVFPVNFFDAGNIVLFELSGAFTSNAANHYMTFTITFPDNGTAATVSTPSTVSADALGDFLIRFTSRVGYDTSGNAVVTHSGTLEVANTDAATGNTTTLFATTENSFTFSDVIYYKPQITWSTQDSNNVVQFYSASLTMV